jgi:TPR repeat protein
MEEEMPPPPFDPNRPVRSQMIFGYAAAMHNLGVRYEEGRRGTPRNLQEAVRCYIKSARLGNDRAMDRLTGR